MAGLKSLLPITEYLISMRNAMKAGLALSLLSAGCCIALGAGDAPTDEQVRFFESQVRPLLIERCVTCHGSEKQKGELRLDSKAAVLKGGESGAAVTPGKLDESLLIDAIRYESLKMPPAAPLSAKEIEILVRWVEMGAPWPAGDKDPLPVPKREKITDEDRKWWAFQPVVDPVPPMGATGTWGESPIDAFLWKKMQADGLSPAPEADRVTLVRRLYLDVVGLPPTPAQVEAFVTDGSENAYARLVDGLLSSPQYGERWARKWLDLVRYADSDGYRIDHYRPDAWRYRDYVIAAFNNDKPYDRFVQEQIAGDELFPEDLDAQVATGYLRHWIYEYNNRDAKTQWSTILNDITDTTSDVFLGMGMQCARCHDHKFDPILQKDYFRLQAFFASISPRDTVIASQQQKQQHVQQLQQWEDATAKIREEMAAMEQPIRDKLADEAIGRFPPDVQVIVRKPEAERSAYDQQIRDLCYRQVYFEYEKLESRLKGDEKERWLALRKELAKQESLMPKPLPVAMTVVDVSPSAPPTLIPKKKDGPVAPGFLTILDAEEAKIDAGVRSGSTGRRAALAKWITRPENPLTARVIVNRVWQHYFGKGLAPNASDFGHLGGTPSHPELLDHLAAQFVRDGWSLKALHRRILMTAVYRQGTAHPQFADFQTRDPQNQWYWRGNTRRLDAEQIRDALLAVSGSLQPQSGGPGVLPDVPRRTIFTRSMRNSRDPLLDVFDLPLFFSSESSRNTTTTPVQSLLLFNSPEMLRYSASFANRIYDLPDSTQRVTEAWRLAFGRSPRPEEVRASQEFLAAQEVRLKQQAEGSAAPEVVTGRIPYRDGQAVAISPSAERPMMSITHDKSFDLQDFTVENYFQIRSIFDSGSVRTMVAKWNGAGGKPGWSLGVTGKGSRRKPQTLVLQMWGKKRDGSFGEAAVFSDQHVELNKPYFAAATVKMASSTEAGEVVFYLKDLSNDDEPLLIARVSHEITGGIQNEEPITIGGRGADAQGHFDGLIDDVRVSSAVLSEERLAYTAEASAEQTVGYWRFEPDPGVLSDSSGHRFDIASKKKNKDLEDPQRAAFVDFCHALLNANEFLYVK